MKDGVAVKINRTAYIGVLTHADMFGESLGALEAPVFSNSLKLRFHAGPPLAARYYPH